MNNNNIILIAEDDIENCSLITHNLNIDSFKIICTTSGAETFEFIKETEPFLILMDYRLPDMTADILINKLNENNLNIPFIIMTDYTDVKIAIEMMKLGASDYLLKNSTFPDFLPAVVNQVIEEIKTSKKLAEAESALRESEEKYRNIVESSKILICHFKPEGGIITFVNNAFCKYMSAGSEELLGKNFWELFPDIDKHLKKEDLNLQYPREPIITEEHMINTPEGERWQRWIIQALFNARGKIYEFQAMGEDITDWKKSEIEKEKVKAHLMQAQKMDAIGALAAGVAHDFNNLLTAIIGSANLCMQKINESNPDYSNLQQIQHAAVRAADLARQLLLFGRKQKIAPVAVNLNKTLQNMVKMLSRVISEDIRINLSLDPGLSIIQADEGNIEQVIMNLAINARDSMSSGGKITFTTKNILLDEYDCKEFPDIVPGPYVCLSVEDTGSGMSEEIIQRIFEPFFTTKEASNNTGLGLAVVFSIVKQHTGCITVQSEPGKGTQFNIFLPAIPFDQHVELIETLKEKISAGNGERILLVEDQEEVRKFVSAALRLNGYIVHEVNSADESVKLFHRENGNFDLIFSDVVLPDKDGLLLVEQLIKMKHDIKVLLTSGYTDNKSQWPLISEKGYRFLPKPFSLNELLSSVHKVLNSG